MIEMVSHGLANLEVSLTCWFCFKIKMGVSLCEVISDYNGYSPQVTLKHSGSLFMYAGHYGGAYAKNSFGNVYVALICADYYMISVCYV